MIDTPKHDETSDAKQLRSAYTGTAFVLIAVFLVVTFWRFEGTRSEAKSLHEKYTAELQLLNGTNMKLADGSQQAKADKKVIFNVLDSVREPEDIPLFQGRHVVAKNYDGCFYLPPGNHQLEITAAWKPDAKIDPKQKTFTGKDSWTIPVLGDAGFQFQIDRTQFLDKPKGGPVSWVLESSQNDFATIRETLPIESFINKGHATNWRDAIAMPNSSSTVYALNKKETATISPLKVYQFKLFGECDKVMHTIEFVIHVRSDGPGYVHASDAARLILMQQSDLLMPYQGNGAFRLRTKTPANP